MLAAVNRMYLGQTHCKQFDSCQNSEWRPYVMKIQNSICGCMPWQA